jgi:UDP-N-acetylglucosamine 1-carboxyvinyltransferase
MDRILIKGGVPLEGTVEISGAKNAALPIMCASLLMAEPLDLANVPDLLDIASTQKLLQHLGVSTTHVAGEPNRMVLHAPRILTDTAPYDLVRKMRASVLVLGPLLARTGAAKVSLPGGCAIGPRPIDLHLMGMERLGATIELEGGYVHAKAAGGLSGGEIRLPQPSVGATENLLMAAVLARGESLIAGAAREPEIVDLADCLVAMGAKIEGAGSSNISIEGVLALHAASHAIIPDRIEAGTYAMAAGVTGGSIVLKNARLDFLGAAKEVIEAAGMILAPVEGGVLARVAKGGLKGSDAMTRPFPGFATDLQAQFMALMSVADGAAMITETIFENRFMHVPELARMGARINVHGASAMVRGVKELKGAPVMATDLRASVSLVLAALAAKGETEINRIYHLDRGYERLEDKLGGVGARIERVP